MWTYRLRYVRCGKAGCSKDAMGGHGPYWYAYEHRGSRVYSKYCGKRPTSTFIPPEGVTEEPRMDSRWVFNGKMDMRTALRIFGVDHRPNQQTLIARYRILAMENHPDRGGDTRIMAAINRAYDYLK